MNALGVQDAEPFAQGVLICLRVAVEFAERGPSPRFVGGVLDCLKDAERVLRKLAYCGLDQIVADPVRMIPATNAPNVRDHVRGDGEIAHTHLHKPPTAAMGESYSFRQRGQ